MREVGRKREGRVEGGDESEYKGRKEEKAGRPGREDRWRDQKEEQLYGI